MRWPAACCLVLLGASAAAGAGPREVLAECARHAPQDAVGLDELEESCPGLEAALAELGLGELLAQGARETLSAPSLGDAARLMDRAEAPPHVPDPASLPRILKGLNAEAPKPGWWERLKAWLRERLSGSHEQASGGRLAQWLEKLTPSQAVVDALMIALLVLVVAGALVVVINELRVSGVLARRRPPGAARARRPGPELPRAEHLTLAAVSAAPAAERPRLLLRLIVEALAASGRLRGAGSLTHRELAERAELDDATGRARLGELAALAEHQLFDPRGVPLARLEPALADGAALYEAVSRTPGAARS